MAENRTYFFCGIGGIGMLPLALYLQAAGYRVLGSDRSRDQGRMPEKYAALEALGIKLFPQDGSGVTADVNYLVVSTAVEDSVPDYKAARTQGIPVLLRAELLTQFFNQAATRIAVGGTSGKSTTTAMIGWLLNQAKLDPTIINGAVMKNFIRPDFDLSSTVNGSPNLFVCEADESDGSIALWQPTIAVLNNIAPEHKPLPELRTLFYDFITKAVRAVLNIDNAEVAALIPQAPTSTQTITYSLQNTKADFYAHSLRHLVGGVEFMVTDHAGTTVPVQLQVPGEHNVYNAMAALAAVNHLVDLSTAARFMAGFKGVRRRLDVVGTARGITVIDDISQNAFNIASNMKALHLHPGRLILIFQPHGYGVNNRDRHLFIDGLTQSLRPDDVLFMTDPLYLGGTVNPVYLTSDNVTDAIRANGRNAARFATREECLEAALAMVQTGDRIVVMGARDDSLHAFAQGIVARLSQQAVA